jgi:3-hydroxyisobutyrate dehydrogenase
MPLGFIGTGVMGEPICRNLAARSGQPVVAWDRSAEALERLRSDGVGVAACAADVVRAGHTLFLCLPDGKALESLCESILTDVRAGQTIVDLGTSGVALTRRLAERFAAKGVEWADAPIARTREAAQKGTLSIMVGAEPAVFARIEPLLRHLGTDVTHCGGIGNGQVVKILNNMVLFETVNALAEALALGQRSGVDAALLFDTLAKGSADSFALRNHGMKAMLPGIFPERAFSTEYALKDMQYALELGRETGVPMRGAETTHSVLAEARERGYGAAYWPVIARIVDR